MASRPVGGVLSAPRGGVVIHLTRPTRDVGRAARPCSALLRVGFAEPPGSPRALVRSYRTVSPLPVPRGAIGGLFSVALSCGSPRLAVSQHPALWSPDLPRPGHAGPRPPGRLAVSIVPRTGTIPHKCRPICQSRRSWEQRSEVLRNSDSLGVNVEQA